jgi:hypothetical protein
LWKHDIGHIKPVEGYECYRKVTICSVDYSQRGSDIDGEKTGDLFGGSMSLSSDGGIVAVGACHNYGNGLFSGHLRVFEWNGSDDIKHGGDIDGEVTK